MSTSVARAGQFVVYGVFRVAAFLLGLLPLPVVFRLGGVLGTIVYAVAPPYRKLVERNVRIAFPDGGVDPREVFSTLGANLLSSLKVASMPPEVLRKHFELEGVEHRDAAVADGGGVVFAIAHLGCWELLAQCTDFSDGVVRRASLFQPLGNPYFNRYVKRLRERTGTELLDRSSGFNRPLEILRNNGAVGVLADQHAGDKGIWSPFFGRLASSTNLAALFAKRSGAAVLPLGVVTTGVARWTMVIGEPVDSRGRSTGEITAAVNRAIENLVRRSPQDWFWVHRRWKTPQPNFLLQGYKRGISLPSGMSESDLNPFRLLVRSPNWLGDACMAVPAIRAIRRGRPDLHLTILAPEKLAGFWREIPEVDTVVAGGKDEGALATAKRLRSVEGGFDAGVLFPNSTRTAVEMRFGGVPEVVGFKGSFRSKLLTKVAKDRTRPGPVEHHSRHYLRLAKELGADIDDPSLFDPIAPPSDPGKGRLRLALCPGAEYGAAKRWPAERFAEVASGICDGHPDCEWIIVGVAADVPYGKTIEDALSAENVSNQIGKTSLAELISELRSCDLLLTNDTGTMHLAALFGVPTVSVFGSTDPDWTGPLGDNHTVVRQHVECSPCFLRECPIDFRCMQEVSVDAVRAAVEATIARVKG